MEGVQKKNFFPQTSFIYTREDFKRKKMKYKTQVENVKLEKTFDSEIRL